MRLILSKHSLLWVAVASVLYVEAAWAQSSAIRAATESGKAAAEPVTKTKESNKSDRGGALKLGAFFITNISTKLGLSDVGTPVGGIIDLNDELGMEESVVLFGCRM